jgi:hypothetical protein
MVVVMASQRLLLAAALTAVVLGTAGAGIIVAPSDVRRMIEVREVSTEGDTVSGQLVNLTDSTLEDVTLLIEDNFLWRDEFHPGDESPGRAETRTVDRVLPRSTLDFSVSRPAPEPRSDGRFQTTVRVLGLTERSRPTEPTPSEPPAPRAPAIPADAD